MNEIIKVAEDRVQDIRMKDLTATAMREVINNYLEMHALSDNAAALNSAVFEEYQKRYVEAKAAFEAAKDSMITECIEDGKRAKIVSWNLNYSSCELMLTLNQQ